MVFSFFAHSLAVRDPEVISSYARRMIELAPKDPEDLAKAERQARRTIESRINGFSYSTADEEIIDPDILCYGDTLIDTISTPLVPSENNAFPHYLHERLPVIAAGFPGMRSIDGKTNLGHTVYALHNLRRGKPFSHVVLAFGSNDLGAKYQKLSANGHHVTAAETQDAYLQVEREITENLEFMANAFEGLGANVHVVGLFGYDPNFSMRVLEGTKTLVANSTARRVNDHLAEVFGENFIDIFGVAAQYVPGKPLPTNAGAQVIAAAVYRQLQPHL